MGSFLATLEKDLKIAGKAAVTVAPFAAEAVSIFDPPLGLALTGIVGKVTSAIVSVEKAASSSGATGQQKRDNVVQDFTSALALASAITGDQYTFDSQALQKGIDAYVTAMNLMSEFVTTVKKVQAAQ